MDVTESNIRTAIIRCVANYFSTAAAPQTSQVLDAYMTSANTRDMCYSCAISLAEEDPQRRNGIAELLCSYIGGFPPSDVVLERLLATSGRLSIQSDSAVLDDLFQIVTAVHSHTSVARMLSRLADPPVLDFRAADATTPVMHYVSKMALAPVTMADADRSKRGVPITAWNLRECANVASEKNAQLPCENNNGRLFYSIASCKDYIDQTHLSCSGDVMNAQIQVLGTYYDNYRTCQPVTLATRFLVKLLCDSYVAKIPLRCNFAFFREVSVAFLPIFLRMMESEYFCVRNHVYDILLTIGMHMQLVDTADAVPGVSAALQRELVWMVCGVVRRQGLVDGADDRVWLAATKCIVAVIPPASLPLIDGRAFKTIMSLPAVCHSHPHIFVIFAEALAAKLLPPDQPAKQGAVDNQQQQPLRWLPLAEDVLHDEFGHTAVSDVMGLFSLAATASARLSIFRIIFSIAVAALQKKQSQTNGTQASSSAAGGGSRLPPLGPDRSAQLSRSLNILIELGFHWHLRSIVCYLPHTLLKELPQQVMLDIDIRKQEERPIKSIVVGILQHIASMVEAHQKLPEAVQRAITASVVTTASSSASSGGEGGRTVDEASARDLLKLLPTLAKDDADGSLRRIATRATFHCLRVFRTTSPPSSDATTSNSAAGESILSLVVKSVALSQLAKVRSICPEVLMALSLLSRTQPQQAAAFHTLLKGFLSRELSPSTLVALYYSLMETLVVQHGATVTDGDVSSIIVQGQFQVHSGAVEAIGAPLFWSLYWALRGVPFAAAQRARYTIASILCSMDLPGSSTHQIALWTKVMADPFPPCAVIGAQKIIRISGLSAYDKYEAAVSEAQRAENPQRITSSYTMAMNIWHRVEAEMKQRAQPSW